MTETIDREWADALLRRGVDPRELADRWQVIERLGGAFDALADTADELQGTLGCGIEGQDVREPASAAAAMFDQALAEFSAAATEARRYAGGA